MPKLVDSGCAMVAVILRSHSNDAFKEKFGINIDMTIEEENELKKKYAWVLQIDKDRFKETKLKDEVKQSD